MTDGYAISLFPGGLTDTWPRPALRTWPELARTLTNFPTWPGERDAVPLWSPARYREGARRGKSGVLGLSLLVLDVDDGAPLDVVLGAFPGVSRLWHSTWSHTPEAPRYRVVVPLDEEVPADAWGRVWAWAQARIGRHADEATKDASRMFFLPVARPGRAYGASVVDFGSPVLAIPWDDLEPEKRPPPRRPWRAPSSSAPDWERRKAACERLKVDPAARAWAAERVGARVIGDFARGAMCPQCGRPSVWWPLNPASLRGCACSHRESCGWTGWLDQLIAASSAPEVTA